MSNPKHMGLIVAIAEATCHRGLVCFGSLPHAGCYSIINKYCNGWCILQAAFKPLWVRPRPWRHAPCAMRCTWAGANRLFEVWFRWFLSSCCMVRSLLRIYHVWHRLWICVSGRQTTYWPSRQTHVGIGLRHFFVSLLQNYISPKTITLNKWRRLT